MENKLQELTQKIYSEGIEKAKSDAVSIVQDAQKTAEEIIKKAQQDAVDIAKKALDNATEVKRNAESEIRMASKQAANKLKQQIVELVTLKAIDAPVKETLKDKKFVGTLIQKVIDNLGTNGTLVLPKADEDNIAAYFNDQTVAELKKSLQIDFDRNMKAGFKISPKEGNYTISFTDEDFANYFKGFMRPKTIQLLFGE